MDCFFHGPIKKISFLHHLKGQSCLFEKRKDGLFLIVDYYLFYIFYFLDAFIYLPSYKRIINLSIRFQAYRYGKKYKFKGNFFEQNKTTFSLMKTDRPKAKESETQNPSPLSDRILPQSQQKTTASRMQISNEELQEVRSSKDSQSSTKSKRHITIFTTILNSIRNEYFSTNDQQTRQQQQRVRYECKICEEVRQIEQVKEFGICKHEFCEECLKQYLKHKLDSFQLIVCPLQGCQAKIDTEGYIYKQILSEQDRRKYKKVQLQLEILANPNLRLCKSQQCQGIINLQTWKEQITQNPTAPIHCPACSLEYCKQCFQQKHEGSCQKNIVKFLQRNKKFRQCKKCLRVIQKSQGCTHMTCLCGHYFCYMCGEELSAGIHECNVPSHLNCVEKVRWEIEHKEMFYESNFVSFHRCLYCFQLSSKTPGPLLFLYSLFYTLSVYPLSIVLFLVLVVLFFALIIVILVLLFLFLPLSEICTSQQYSITQFVSQTCGTFGLAACVIMFYPVFVLWIMVEAMTEVCRDEETWEEVHIFFGEIGSGFRNVLMMPFVLCVNPESLDAAQEKLNEHIQNGQAAEAK